MRALEKMLFDERWRPHWFPASRKKRKKVILVCTDLGGFGGRMIIREVTEKGENQGQIVAGG